MSAQSSKGFALPDLAADKPVRLILVGAGGMGKEWLRVIKNEPQAKLVGVVDLDLALAERAVEDAGLALRGDDAVIVGSSASAVAARSNGHAVVNVTIPAAHHPVNVEALFAGLPVLCEKPIAPTVAQALSLAAAAEASGQLLMTSQSRRYYAGIAAFREQVASLGRLGLASTQFFKAPHFGGFRDEMAHVLLVDMAIHAFDASRYVLGLDPVSVYCEEFNPSWSWYSRDAAATAIFEFEGGLRYSYAGNWAADGVETSWNGTWRVNGERGTATWDGEGAPLVQYVGETDVRVATLGDRGLEEIAGSLVEFLSALRTGIVPSGEVHANVTSLAMVEAAVRSAESSSRILIADVLEDAYSAALVAERREDVRAVLESWGSATAGLR